MGILGADGAFAELGRACRSPTCTPCRTACPTSAAVFTEPLAAAFEILEQVRVEPGTDCIVLGDGKLGLLAAQVLHAAGARVLAVGKHADKLAMLRRRGIATRVASDAPLGPRADSSSRPPAAALGFALAVAATRPRGTLVLKSTSPSSRASTSRRSSSTRSRGRLALRPVRAGAARARDRTRSTCAR